MGEAVLRRLLVGEVLGLFPVVGCPEQLEGSLPGGDAHHHPVEGHQEGEFRKIADAAADTGERGRVDEDEVPDEKAEGTHCENGDGEVLVETLGAPDEPQERHDPVERVDKLREEGAADEQVELQAVEKAHALVEPEEVPRMDAVGLHIPLDPARTLLDPERHIGARLLPSGRFQDARAIPHRKQPQPQIAVLGDIVFVPALGLSEDVEAEVVGGAAEGDGSLQAIEAREAESEPGRVLRREEAREEVLLRVVVTELRLDARDIVGNLVERPGRLLELVGFWVVLRIVDDEQIGLAVLNSDVAGLGLGARIGLRDGDDFERWLQVHRERGVHRLGIILLDEEADFKAVLGIVELREALNELW